jgi:hypothetical protein
MEAELLLDGLATHNNFFHCMNPVHAERIKRALSAVRSARDILRNDAKGRQLTLYTRGKKLNRKGVGWYFNVQRADWKCGCNKPFTKKGVWTEGGRKPKNPTRKERVLNAEPMSSTV